MIKVEEKPPRHELAKIMIIDDIRSNTLLLEKLFLMEGYRNITIIHDPAEAVEAINREDPDVLLLDLNMPIIDGFEIMAILKDRKHPLLDSLLVVTAYQDSVSRHRSLQLGARDFLTKPFDPTEVALKVRHILETNHKRKLREDHNMQLEAQLLTHTLHISELQEEYVLRLIQTMKHRDNDTGRHLMRMSQYVFQVAKKLGLNEEDCHSLRYASAMHDIGKLAIPDKILLKNGQLTPEEFEVMKIHTTKGAELLSGSRHEVLKLAERIALTHHERWDGSGYPHGLKRGEIPLEGRIVAVCDVFDALTSTRPYKSAWTEGEALAEIQRQSGAHFDPLIVQVFSEIFTDIQTTRMQWLD